MNYRFFILVLLLVFFVPAKSQKRDTLKPVKKIQYAFNPGDIILSVNLGYPHVTPFILRTSIKAYSKFVNDQALTFTLTSHGVYNAKAEYALLDNLGLGIAASYWDMKFNIQNDYSSNGVNYTDNLDVTMSASAIGLRGNFHLTDEVESRVLDPYTGLTIGTTYYQKNFDLRSTNPERQIDQALPKKILNFHDGWSTYFSATFGIRIYPVKYMALNIEAGWDRGAFLFGGLAVKIPTPAIKSFQD